MGTDLGLFLAHQLARAMAGNRGLGNTGIERSALPDRPGAVLNCPPFPPLAH